MKTKTPPSKEKQEDLAYKLMGWSVLFVLLSVFFLLFFSVRILASRFLETNETYQRVLVETPFPLILVITTIGFSIALFLAWTAVHIVPNDAPLAGDAVIVTAGWFFSVLGTLVIWFVYTEKILRMEFF